MTEDWMPWARLILPILSIIFNALLAWAGWSLRKAFVSQQRCSDCRKELIENNNKLERRISKNEDSLCNFPDNNALHEIALAVERLRGDLSAMGKEIDGLRDVVDKVDRIVERQETYLLNGGK